MSVMIKKGLKAAMENEKFGKGATCSAVMEMTRGDSLLWHLIKNSKTMDYKRLYLFTDCVFDIPRTESWHPNCKDYKPLNVYG